MTDISEVADKAKAEVRALETDAAHIGKRIDAAIERWYAEHFHKAMKAGVQPISAIDKAALSDAVKSAAAPQKE